MNITSLRRYLEFVPDRWLAALAGLVMGLFLTRFAYEVWPRQLALLLFWPAGPGLAIGIAALVAALYRWGGARIGIDPAGSIGMGVFFPWILLLLYLVQPAVNLLQALVLFLAVIALSLMRVVQVLEEGDWRVRWGARFVLGVALLALYLPTMGRTVGEADTFEFQVVAPALGVAHPTGYPLYILLGKLFSLLPFGQVAWRVNLTSVTCATVAVILVYSIVSSRLESRPASSNGRRAPARHRSHYYGIFASLSLVASPVFWSQAIVAEVYALNAAFVALLLWLLLYGLGRRRRSSDWNARRWLFTLALVYGLSLTNHLTMVLLTPGLALVVWWVRPPMSRRDWLKAAGLLVLGLFVYLYIPVRWPALHSGQLMPLSEFIGWVTGRQFGGALQFGLWRDPTRWHILERLLLEAYGPVGAGLAALGGVALVFRQRHTAIISGLTFIAYCVYALVYNVPDISVFLIPAYLVMAIWIGAGMAWISDPSATLPSTRLGTGRTGFGFRISDLGSRISGLGSWVSDLASRISHLASRARLPVSNPSTLLRTNLQSLILRLRSGQASNLQLPALNLNLKSEILNLIFVLLPLSLIWTNMPLVDQSQSGQPLMEWGRYVLSLPLSRQAVILADSEKIAPLYYLKRIEGVRSDLDTLVMGSEELYRAELERRLAQGQPVYLARFLPGLAGVYRLHSLGPLVRVSTTPQMSMPLVPITRRLNVSFGNGQVRLAGHDLRPGEGNVAYRLTLYWQAQEALPANYHVRLRLVSEAGRVWWEDPGTHPVAGYNPTGAWWPGEVVPDYHEVPFRMTLPPGRYRLEVGLFLPFSDKGLRLDGSTGDVWYNLAWVSLNQGPARAEASTAWVALRANFGDQVLLRGASQPGVVPPGGRGEVILEWEKLPPPGERGHRLPGDYLQVTLARVGGGPFRVLQVKPYMGEHPLSRWEVGGRLWTKIDFVAPDEPGEYTVRLGWVDELGKWIAARCGWMMRAAYECPVATLRVEGARREAGINFANQVVLVRSQVEREAMRPGETLGVNLRWQGLKAWPDDYTAFVHLVGPDGRLHGQVDAYPVHGSLPTTQWKAGQIVDDPYLVPLAPDAPPGEYQVEVGWYLLASLRRLGVLDSAGRPVDNRVVVGTIEVLP